MRSILKSKKVFLDINIIVDFIEPARARNKSAIQLFELLISNSYQIYISEDMLSTIFYIVKDKSLVLRFFKVIQDKWHIVGFGGAVIRQAIDLSLEKSLDFEDTLQCLCAKENNWEAIKNDLNKNPIENITGSHKEEEILNILEKYGIKQFKIQNSKFKISIEIWGSGKPRREFLWSEDMADACVFIMENRNFEDVLNQQVVSSKLQVENCKTTQKELPTTHHTLPTEVRNTHINIGTGKDISIKELAELIKDIIGFKGNLVFNTDKPDGTMIKLTDPSKLHSLGWKHTVELNQGIEKIYNWYIENKNV